MSKPKLVLIDGHSLAYRAFFALPPDLKTRGGELTNAVYGFASMLLAAWRDEQPDYIAVAFDVGKTFRDDMYADYKATRAKMPDELASQLDRIQQIVKAFNLPVITAEGFEADDILGTLAIRAAHDGLDTLIITGDTDAFQLIGPSVHVLTSQRKWSETKIYDEAAVRERYGLDPRQLIDYKALVGDTSDNVPGVRGVGDKTATQLLQQFGSVDGIYKHLDEITAKRARTSLEAGRESAALSKKLITIKTDVPLKVKWDDCRTAAFDREQVVKLFREMEFRSLIERLPGPQDTAPVKAKAVQQMALFAVSDTEQKPQKAKGKKQEDSKTQVAEPVTQTRIAADEGSLKQLAAALSKAKFISFDVETTSTDPMQAELVGISLAVKAGEGWYVPVGHAGAEQLPLEQVAAALRPALEDESIAKVGHNAKYDMAVLARNGIAVRGLNFDTMMAEWLIDPASRNLGLKNLAWSRLGVEMTRIEELIGTGKKQITMDQVPVESAAAYAAADADIPLRLRSLQEPELREKNLWKLFTQVEMPLVPVLMDMEMTGVLIDVPYLREMSGVLTKRLTEIEREIYTLVGLDFNINSTQQLADVLFGKLGLKAPAGRKTATGKTSTAVDVLESLRGQHPVIELILEQRQLSKLKSTYIDALPELVNPATGRVHTSYNQAGAVTGRLSSSEPNLQNIPIRTDLGRQVRRAFIAAPGHVLMSADYSQVELRILAHLCGDPGLREAFSRGEDIHATTAAAIFGVALSQVTSDQRRVAKAVNFGLAYGQGAYGLAQATGLSNSDAQKFIDAYFARFSHVRQYIEETKRKAATIGYVETIMGRRRYFPILQSKERDPRTQMARRAAERECINMPVQGSAADIMKVAMLKVKSQISNLKSSTSSVKMMLQVHDELVFEVPEREVNKVAKLVREAMEGAASLSVPLKVDVKAGKNWDEAK
jgi:DNA polymerase-1